MTTETRKPDTAAEPPRPDDAGPDAIGDIQSLPIVKSVGFVTKPILHETLRANEARPRMRTMSDLAKNGDKGGFEHGVAKTPKQP